MNPILTTILLLVASNVFMTFAWYGHLKFKSTPLILAIVASWGIAFAEYCFQVPANRIGHDQGYSGSQLKIMQEAITLAVFVPFAVFYMKQPVKLDYLWASVCILGAVYFIFRG